MQRLQADAAKAQQPAEPTQGFSPRTQHNKLRESLHKQQVLTREELERLKSEAAKGDAVDSDEHSEQRGDGEAVASSREWFALGRLVTTQPQGDIKVGREGMWGMGTGVCAGRAGESLNAYF